MAVDGAKLRQDGKLAGPWVCELKLRCEPILAKSERIQMLVRVTMSPRYANAGKTYRC